MPCIFPTSLERLGDRVSQGAGLMVMMVVGGAVIPELLALAADRYGFQPSFVIVLLEPGVCCCGEAQTGVSSRTGQLSKHARRGSARTKS